MNALSSTFSQLQGRPTLSGSYFGRCRTLRRLQPCGQKESNSLIALSTSSPPLAPHGPQAAPETLEVTELPQPSGSAQEVAEDGSRVLSEGELEGNRLMAEVIRTQTIALESQGRPNENAAIAEYLAACRAYATAPPEACLFGKHFLEVLRLLPIELSALTAAFEKRALRDDLVYYPIHLIHLPKLIALLQTGGNGKALTQKYVEEFVNGRWNNVVVTRSILRQAQFFKEAALAGAITASDAAYFMAHFTKYSLKVSSTTLTCILTALEVSGQIMPDTVIDLLQEMQNHWETSSPHWAGSIYLQAGACDNLVRLARMGITPEAGVKIPFISFLARSACVPHTKAAEPTPLSLLLHASEAADALLQYRHAGLHQTVLEKVDKHEVNQLNQQDLSLAMRFLASYYSSFTNNKGSIAKPTGPVQGSHKSQASDVESCARAQTAERLEEALLIIFTELLPRLGASESSESVKAPSVQPVHPDTPPTFSVITSLLSETTRLMTMPLPDKSMRPLKEQSLVALRDLAIKLLESEVPAGEVRSFQGPVYHAELVKLLRAYADLQGHLRPCSDDICQVADRLSHRTQYLTPHQVTQTFSSVGDLRLKHAPLVRALCMVARQHIDELPDAGLVHVLSAVSALGIQDAGLLVQLERTMATRLRNEEIDVCVVVSFIYVMAGVHRYPKELLSQLISSYRVTRRLNQEYPDDQVPDLDLNPDSTSLLAWSFAEYYTNCPDDQETMRYAINFTRNLIRGHLKVMWKPSDGLASSSLRLERVRHFLVVTQTDTALLADVMDLVQRVRASEARAAKRAEQRRAPPPPPPPQSVAVQPPLEGRPGAPRPRRPEFFGVCLPRPGYSAERPDTMGGRKLRSESGSEDGNDTDN